MAQVIALRDSPSRMLLTPHPSIARLSRHLPAAVPSTSDILAAVLGRQFGAEYQPIVELSSRRVIGHEALSRFTDAAGRSVCAASVFACLHDEPSLLLYVEAETKRFQMEHAPDGPLYVNVAPESFRAAERAGHNPLLDLLAAREGETVVEVIEAMNVADARVSRGLVDGLRALGIRVALDDIGAPDALLSLEALAGADVLKLDRTWLERAGDEREWAVLESLLVLAKRLGACTILEGIETRTDLAVAERLGVDAVQGYLFRPHFVTAHAS